MSNIFKWSPDNTSGTLRSKTSTELSKETTLKSAKDPIKESISIDNSNNISQNLFYNDSKKLETHSSGVTITGTANVDTVDLGNWTITESGGVLYFATGGTNKMKLDASGNLTVVGDVSAFGTV